MDKNANYLGEEDKGRTPGRIDGGKVQPGPGRPERWLNKGGKREKWGEITEQYFIFHIRKRAKSRKPRKGMGTRRARYGRGRSGHPLHSLQQLGTKKFRLIWLGRIRKKLNTLTYSRIACVIDETKLWLRPSTKRRTSLFWTPSCVPGFEYAP